jgi:hypothetical protein
VSTAICASDVHFMDHHDAIPAATNIGNPEPAASRPGNPSLGILRLEMSSTAHLPTPSTMLF